MMIIEKNFHLHSYGTRSISFKVFTYFPYLPCYVGIRNVVPAGIYRNAILFPFFVTKTVSVFLATVALPCDSLRQVNQSNPSLHKR